MRSYLSNRFQRVVLRGVMSDWLKILAGVPQGSILGPLLYLIFSNDISERINSIIKLFADDTTMAATSTTAEECCNTLKPDIQIISDWAMKWKVTLCPEKTKCLTVSRVQHSYCPLKMAGLYVEEVSTHCHLGVRLQSDGKWSDQIDHMVRKAEERIKIMKAYSRRLNRQALRQLYLSYVRPILEYASQVWCNCTLGQETLLECVQLAAIRAITGAKVGTSHRMLYKELSLPLLERRRFQARMCKMQDLLHSDTPDRLNQHSFPRVSSRNVYSTRRTNDLSIPLVNTELSRRSFVPRSINEWNLLPETSREITTKNGLKLRISPKIWPNPYYSIEEDRPSAINLTRLRVGNSNLHLNLFRRGLSDTPACECGARNESTAHYLLECPIHERTRSDAKAAVPDQSMWNTNDILHGSTIRYSKNENELLCRIVQRFIKSTNRFA